MRIHSAAIFLTSIVSLNTRTQGFSSSLFHTNPSRSVAFKLDLASGQGTLTIFESAKFMSNHFVRLLIFHGAICIHVYFFFVVVSIRFWSRCSEE